MDMLKKLKSKSPALRTRLAVSLSVMVLVTAASGIFYTAQVNSITASITGSQQVYYDLNALSASVESIKRQLDIYAREKRPSAYTAYYEESRNIKRILQKLDEAAIPSGQYFLRAMKNTAECAIRDCNKFFYQINSGSDEAYMASYRAESELTYFSRYVSEYLNVMLAQDYNNQRIMAVQMGRAEAQNYLFLFASIAFALVLTANFADYITRPIAALAQGARRISRGDFDQPDIPVTSDDELGQLTESFNAMRVNIEENIENLNRRAELEAKLHQQEMENMRINQLLRESQYLALQSQINPHFLFNTLNAIARAALHDTPKTTTTLIYNLADMFRYNLEHVNDYSRLCDELAVVEKYVYIQRHRFRDRIRYRVTGAGGYGWAMVPSMLLQPLVENAIVHGIEDLEQGGDIVVNARERSGRLLLRVYDNGRGMDKQTLRAVRQGQRVSQDGSGTGIGLSNIESRVRLTHNADFKINSSRRGTLVQILLPLLGKENEV